MNRLATNGHTNGKLRFSAQDWIGPQHGDRGGTYWESRKTGEKVYSPTNPGGQESQSEQPQQASQQAAKPDLKAIGAKYAQQAREKWGDKAHENLTKIAANLSKDESPEAQKKLAAVKAMLSAVQAEAVPESAPSEAPAETPAKQPEAADKGLPAEPAASSEPSPGEPILEPEKQQAVNERKRSGMAPEVIQSEKKKQYLKTDRGEAEEFRDRADAEEEVKRKKEDDEHKAKKEAMEARHGEEWAAAESKVDAVQSRRDQLEDSRNEEDAADEAARQKEDEDFEAKTQAEDERLQKDREAEDDAIEAQRAPIRDQLTDAWHATEDGTPEDAATKKALDDAEAKWEKEDDKRTEKRDKYDDKATEAYEKANEKREADREKYDEKIRKAREAEDKKLDNAEAKVEAERDNLEAKHQQEIDDLDQEEADRETERDKDDEQVREDREEEDAGFDEQDEKEADEATELIDSFEETDDAPAKSPEEQLDAVRKYNEMAAKTGKRNRIIWYEGKAFQGWANENIDNVSDDDFDRFCPLPNERQPDQPVQSSADYDGSEPVRYAEDRISLDELRRMPGPEAAAYAKGVLAMLARRPDLRKEFSLQDLAYLQAIAQDVDRYAADEPTRYEAGHWITIGGTKGEDGERHGGSPVFIQNGKITKGHPSLTGKKIGNLKEKAEGGTVRTANKQERDYGRAKAAKEAKAQGVDPKHLHALAAEIKAHHDASGADVRNMLTEIKRDYPHLKAAILSAERGGDSAAIKNLDTISQSMAHRPEYTHLFGGHSSWEGVEEDHSEKLYDYLVSGAPAKMTEEDAYEQALDHIKRHGVHADEEEPVPFAALWDESEHPRDQDGKFTNHWATKAHIGQARKQLAKGELKVMTGEATSSATGKPIKRYVELENGAKIHPDELHRTKFGEGDEPYVSTNENLSVTDGNGTRQVSSFATAVAHAGMSKGSVTISGPHGYSVTLPGSEWKATDASGKTFAEWQDAGGGKAEERKRKLNAFQMRVITEGGHSIKGADREEWDRLKKEDAEEKSAKMRQMADNDGVPVIEGSSRTIQTIDGIRYWLHVKNHASSQPGSTGKKYSADGGKTWESYAHNAIAKAKKPPVKVSGDEQKPLTDVVSGKATEDYFTGRPAGQARLFAADYEAEEA